MINAIYSNLISLLWAQAESIVPTLWLCTWLCWFFILPLFICLYRGLQDFQCRWHGVEPQTKLAESAETRPAWRLIQGGFEAVPILPVSCPPTLLHKIYKMCRSFIIFSIFCFLKCPHPKRYVPDFSSLYLCIQLQYPKTDQDKGQ